MTYAIREFGTWPFRMVIENDGAEVVPVDRHEYSTNDTLASVCRRRENIKQYAVLMQMIERANRAEAAEARASELEVHLVGSAATVTKLTRERDEQQQRADILDHACANALNERDEARQELQHIRTMLDDGTQEEGASALDMVRELHKRCYEAQREAWHARM